jgi:predicted carbohydrate-binding protein with CBM5 and CBM33 domain
MKHVRQWLGLAALATFLGVFVMESFHGHQSLQTPSSDCSVCKIAHQPASIADKTELPEMQWVVSRAPTLHAPQPYLLFVFASHGLSPPAL